mmetsp:Transcript_88212/g.279008  ORF Transcript_88212/g.279008 Transcript_88212/m.279008 type:complete len:222 (+) Transcript_88212:197-862(+)
MCAGAVVWVAPEKSLAVLLFLGAGAVAVIAPVIGPLALKGKDVFEQLLSDAIGRALVHLLDVWRLDRMLQDLSQTVHKGQLISELMTKVSGAVVMASKHRDLQDSLLGVVKEAVTHSLKDDELMAVMLSMVTKGVTSASQDEDLKEAVLGVTRDAVGQAVKDEAFMNTFKDAICQGLKDSNFYRAAAHGVVSSLNPFKRGHGVEHAANNTAESAAERAPGS